MMRPKKNRGVHMEKSNQSAIRELPEQLQSKWEYLLTYIESLGSLAVGFSGGVDSTFLLAAAHEVLGDKAIAVTAVDASVPRRESRRVLHRKGHTSLRLHGRSHAGRWLPAQQP